LILFSTLTNARQTITINQHDLLHLHFPIIPGLGGLPFFPLIFFSLHLPLQHCLPLLQPFFLFLQNAEGLEEGKRVNVLIVGARVVGNDVGLGDTVGLADGPTGVVDGVVLGALTDGLLLGLKDGATTGLADGNLFGSEDGKALGEPDGALIGIPLGNPLGIPLGGPGYSLRIKFTPNLRSFALVTRLQLPSSPRAVI
jgi:hypothetical protein